MLTGIKLLCISLDNDSEDSLKVTFKYFELLDEILRAEH